MSTDPLDDARRSADDAERALRDAWTRYLEACDEVEVQRGIANPDLAVELAVPIEAKTLDGLTERARREGREIDELVADVLRNAAAA